MTRKRELYEVQVTVQVKTMSTSTSNAAVKVGKLLRKYIKIQSSIQWEGITAIQSRRW